MNILVTGGAGYIGSTLVPLLLAGGHRVKVLDSLLHGGESLLGVWAHPAFEFVRGDIRDRAKLAGAVAGMEAVVRVLINRIWRVPSILRARSHSSRKVSGPASLASSLPPRAVTTGR
jgi:nucleoside-diphosphate-sugar epimerase